MMRSGRSYSRVLEEERSGISSTMLDDDLFETKGLQNTLVCYVLVDKETNAHSFCSRYDFGPWPLFQNMSTLSKGAERALGRTRAVFVNGFVFDEVPEELVVHAARISQEHGAAVLFDPGPRSWSFDDGGVRRHALESMLNIADIVLMTEEEAGAVVGTENALDAVRLLMEREESRMSWCIVKQGERGALLGDRVSGKVYQQDGYKVQVEDTVGCGDSFAAAIALGFTRGTSDIESTLALAGAVGAATAMGEGAGRNVASLSRIRDILESCAAEMPESSQKIRGALAMIHDELLLNKR
jgi:sugar/nucleoside kinase (ribokinase family)